MCIRVKEMKGLFYKKNKAVSYMGRVGGHSTSVD
jgi:hypothetical protein